MRGKPLDDTKNVLSEALSKLEQEDSFSIIAFNGDTYLFSTSMEVATRETVERAIEWMNVNFIAAGGTNILLPLNKVFSHSFHLYVQVIDHTISKFQPLVHPLYFILLSLN